MLVNFLMWALIRLIQFSLRKVTSHENIQIPREIEEIIRLHIHCHESLALAFQGTAVTLAT